MPDAPHVTHAMFTAVAELFGRPACAAVEHHAGTFAIGYKEGRDVCVIARGKTWEEALSIATSRSRLVDQLLTNTPQAGNPTVATAACVPVRFVRIRRRDMGHLGG
jgi:hypothetical protein